MLRLAVIRIASAKAYNTPGERVENRFESFRIALIEHRAHIPTDQREVVRRFSTRNRDLNWLALTDPYQRLFRQRRQNPALHPYI